MPTNETPPKACERCGKQNPAEIHTCTPPKAQTVPELATDLSKIAVGIDFSSGPDKIFATVAQKGDDGNMYILSSEVISSSLATYIQAQEAEIARLMTENETLRKFVGYPRHSEECDFQFKQHGTRCYTDCGYHYIKDFFDSLSPSSK